MDKRHDDKSVKKINIDVEINFLLKQGDICKFEDPIHGLFKVPADICGVAYFSNLPITLHLLSLKNINIAEINRPKISDAKIKDTIRV